jgi:hypothetical protein
MTVADCGHSAIAFGALQASLDLEYIASRSVSHFDGHCHF